MNKRISMLLVIILVLFLTGCGADWDDMEKDYGDVLKSNVSCKYEFSKNTSSNNTKANWEKVKNITLGANSKEIYITFNEKDKHVIKNNKNKKSSATIYVPSGASLNIVNRFSLDSFIKEYKNGGKCQDYIYIYNEGSVNYLSDVKDRPNLIYYYYKLVESKSNKDKGNNKEKEKFDTSCLGNRTISCKNYTIRDYSNHLVYIQLGRQKTTTNEIRKYFAVSYDSKYKEAMPSYYEGGTWGIVINDTKVNKHGTNYFYIEKSEINNLFIGDDSYINELFLWHWQDPSPNQPDIQYYLRSTASDDESVFEGSHSSKETANKSSKNKETFSEFDFCSDTGVKVALRIVGYVLFIIKILVPLLLIIFGAIDLGKAVLSSDDKAISKSVMNLAMRIGAGIIIFFIPTILNVVFNLIQGWTKTKSSFENCQACIFSPFGSDCYIEDFEWPLATSLSSNSQEQLY